MKFVTLILSAIFLTASFSLKAEDTKQIAAKELFETMQFKKSLEDSFEITLQAMKQAFPNQPDGDELTKAFLEKYMSVEKIENDMIRIYAEVFSKEELEALTAFYKSDIGMKILEKNPKILERVMSDTQANLMAHISELESALSGEAQ